MIMARKYTVTKRWYVPEKGGRELSLEEKEEEGTEPRGADMGLLKRGWESGREGGRRSHFHLPGFHGIASERPPLSR